MTATRTTGGCQCGEVRYEITGDLHNPHICHCRMCQKAVGNFFAAFVGAPRSNLRWVKREPAFYQSSGNASRGFCPRCGTPLTFAYDDSDRISVTIGSLDRPAAIQPAYQYGMESQLPSFTHLHELPGSRTEDDIPEEALAKLRSRQHPDHP